MSASAPACLHEELQLDSSDFAYEVGFGRPDANRRLAATTKSGRNPLAPKQKGNRNLVAKHEADVATAFPGPLVLPNDDLAWDPKGSPQSFRSWLTEKERNKPTQDTKTLYVAAVPEITAKMGHMKPWKKPQLGTGEPPSTKSKAPQDDMQSPSAKDFITYLAAFYHGLSVKPFPQRLRFVPWEEDKPDSTQKYVGLATANSCTRIRARPSPDGVFSGQLNLEDILDAAIDMLPTDAYSIVLLIDHDLYEDEEDDYCCGRAYGGSRVSVVSTARYHPALDEYSKIDRSHMWPCSHCKIFVDRLCSDEGLEVKNKTHQSQPPAASPLRAAIDATSGVNIDSSTEGRRGLWFSRLARTVVHELGHCFGMDHCVYYACNMQGTAGMAEDVRQPPYLCPVCLSKISHAISGELRSGDESEKQAYVKERYEALVAVCDQWKHVGLFAGYGAWLRARIASLET